MFKDSTDGHGDVYALVLRVAMVEALKDITGC